MTSQRTRDRLIARLQEKGIHNQRVLEVMRQTPRHIFMDEALATRAYEDTALPIGHGQTISQPFVVARMTELLLEGNPAITKVLEVGTGSGYQTAILSQLIEQVYTLERIAPLLRQARDRFTALGLRNIRTRHSDGSWGWPKEGPFDAIIVTAAPAQLPPELRGQLTIGGVLVIPVGGEVQKLLRITRLADEYREEYFDPVRFVPLIRGDIQ